MSLTRFVNKEFSVLLSGVVASLEVNVNDNLTFYKWNKLDSKIVYPEKSITLNELDPDLSMEFHSKEGFTEEDILGHVLTMQKFHKPSIFSSGVDMSHIFLDGLTGSRNIEGVYQINWTTHDSF